jgi:hypothetical protein
MLQPGDRRVLREALRPPQGYTVDRALATTYSLDLIALLIAPLSFSLFDRIARRDEPGADGDDALGAVALLQAVRAHAERLTVFCQAGSIARPGRYRQLLTYLEGSVVEVVPPAPMTGVFHPKVWVQRFTSPTGPVRYRVLINSRNLTFDRSWDTILALEGELQERTNAIARNHPLGDFLAALPRLAVRPVPRRITADVALVANEIRRVAFEVPEGFEDELTFWPLGHDGKERWPFATKIQRMLVISPFVGGPMLERLCENGSGHILVSRAEELAPVPAKNLAHFEEIHVLNEGAEVEPEDIEGDGSNGADDAARGLHAKLYVADAGRDAHVWTGSANATGAAFGDNVELLVQLTGKKKNVGIDAVLGVVEGAAVGLRALLVAYTPPASPLAVDAIAAALESRLRVLRVAVASAPWKARVEREPEPGDDKERYRVHLQAGRAPIDLGPGVEVHCWPIALPPEHAASLVLSPTGPSVTFARLSFQALTSFFAFRVRAEEGDQHCEVVFVVNAPLEGAPEHRHARILQAMLDDPGKVMRFLRMLLALDPLDGIEELIAGEEEEAAGAAGAWSTGWSDTPLLEALLQALDREPARLADFDRAIRELRLTPEGAALVPPELDLVWLPLREAWEAQSAKGGRR